MRHELSGILERGANDAWGLGLTEAQIDQFVRYAEILVEWNSTRMNLTRLTSPREIAVKHFLDSLAVLRTHPGLFVVPPAETGGGEVHSDPTPTLPLERGGKIGVHLMDVGTGAGLPGLALKIARPDLRVTLLDSTAKKLQFCTFVADSLGLEDVEVVHGRAEEVCRDPRHGQAYGVVTARAVASLAKLLPWCTGFARVGGRVLALKGSGVETEMVDAVPVANRLRLRLESPVSIALPEAEDETVRQIVVATRFAV